MKPQTDILATLSTLRDYLEEAHQEELDSAHHGDESECSYCRAIAKADAILASSSSPDDDQEPDHDDTVHCCPSCEKPNQFGELCPSCTRDDQEALAENAALDQAAFKQMEREMTVSVPTSDFVASCHSLGAHVIDASRPYEEMKKRIVSLIALAIEGSEEYVANDLRHVVERVYQSEDVLWTLREQLPNCEWFECYERFYNAGLLIKVD